jgi:hypothetical protein
MYELILKLFHQAFPIEKVITRSIELYGKMIIK